MKKLTEIFGAKKKTELEKCQEELQIVNSSISEEQTKQARLKEGLRLIEIEREIDNTDKELNKRAKRLENALEESSQRLVASQTRKAQLDSQIDELNAEKRIARLHELAEEDLVSFERGRRATVIKHELDKLRREIESRDGRAGYSSPDNLKNEIGLEYGYFDKEVPVQAEVAEIWEAKKELAEERIQKEAQEVISLLKKYLGE